MTPLRAKYIRDLVLSVIWEIVLRDFWCDILRVSHANPITNVSRTL